MKSLKLKNILVEESINSGNYQRKLKQELGEFLKDPDGNGFGIFGYTNAIHDIMMSNPAELDDFLKDEGIIGYGSRIRRIYADSNQKGSDQIPEANRTRPIVNPNKKKIVSPLSWRSAKILVHDAYYEYFQESELENPEIKQNLKHILSAKTVEDLAITLLELGFDEDQCYLFIIDSIVE